MDGVLVTVLVVGFAIGCTGIVIVPRGRLPSWVTSAAATAGVLLGTLVAAMAGIDVGRLSTTGLIIQVVFGFCAVVVVAAVADRRPVRSGPGGA